MGIFQRGSESRCARAPAITAKIGNDQFRSQRIKMSGQIIIVRHNLPITVKEQ